MRDADGNVEKKIQTVDEEKHVFLDLTDKFDAVGIYDSQSENTDIAFDLFLNIAVFLATLVTEQDESVSEAEHQETGKGRIQRTIVVVYFARYGE